MNTQNYQLCTKTVMDTSDPNITFDIDGVSNHYWEYQEKASKILLPSPQREEALLQTLKEITHDGKNNAYDCLIGLSGGVDSSYIAYKAREWGLRPLIVHFDNGWNSELAVSNIEKLINYGGFDLHTLVVNWNEFKDIQLSFFKAGVPNIEMVTDHAIIATLYRVAKKFNIKYLISGSNLVTEGILPEAWGYDSSDFYHIKKIHQQFGREKIKTYPSLSIAKRVNNTLFGGLKKVNILNFLDYSKENAIAEMSAKVGWQYYGGKHYESVFTQFFQGYVLPTKFGFDKRRAHLSSLICSGQISREQALLALEKPLYDPQLLAEHIEYVVKKWEISSQLFNEILNLPPHFHADYPSMDKWIKRIVKLKHRFGV
jgi:N-acetyl sugar amidotransferase